MGIITNAAALNKNTELVFGQSASGKSTYVRDLLHNEPTLWVAFSNVGALTGAPNVDQITVAEPTNYAEFTGEALPYLRTKPHKHVVFDGLNVMLSMILQQLKPTGPVEQQQWAEAGNMIRNAVLTARGVSDNVYAIVDLVLDDETKQFKMALNPNTIALIMPLFARKTLAYTKPTKNKENKITGVEYLTQNIGALAVKFEKGA